MSGLEWFETVWQDLRFAWRTLGKNRVLTVFVVALLALGIGSTTVVFSLFEAVFLRPLQVRRPEELVRMVQHVPKLRTFGFFPYIYYEALRDHSSTLASVFGETGDYQQFAMTDPEPPEAIYVYGVTPEYFTALGAQALFGRILLPDDAKETPGMAPAVLSYGFWQRRFGGDPAVINKASILVEGHRFLAVGVMPRDFNGITADFTPDVRIPLRAYLLLRSFPKDQMSLQLAGRLKPGVTRSQAEAECLAMWRSTMPGFWRDVYKNSQQAITRELERGMNLEGIKQGVSLLRDLYGHALKLVMASISLLLLIVCTNVAGLLLERAAARQQEMAVRLAVGATHFRIIWQMLAENLLLVLLGTAGGLAVAAMGIPLAMRVLPPVRAYPSPAIMPISMHLGIHWRVFLFLVFAAFLAVILLSVSPALAIARTNLDALLRSLRSSAAVRGRQSLIVMQVALCTFLLVTAALFVSTYRRLQNIDPGFDRYHLVTFSIDLNAHKGPTKGLVTELTQRVRALPGVESVALSQMGVMRGVGLAMTFAAAGQRTTAADFLNTTVEAVSPEYFDTMGMHILSGRGLTAGDVSVHVPDSKAPARVVVNQEFVRRFFTHANPLGKRFGPASPGEVASDNHEIIGVVTDVKYRSPRAPAVPMVYGCPDHFDEFVLNVRTRVPPAAIIAPVRKTLASLDPNLPILEAHTVAEQIDISTGPERGIAMVASLFGGLAAVLVGVGVYSLLAYAVTQRRREIGIRMALGAMRDDVLRLVVGQGLTLTLVGFGVGLLGSLAATRLFATLLYGIKPTDPLTFLAVALFLLALALLASYLPARRASKVDPMVALRYE